MKIIPIIVLIIGFQYPPYAQRTYSKIYDIDSFGIENYIRNLLVFQDHIYAVSSQYCNRDSFFQDCIMIAKLDMQGEIIQSRELDSIAFETSCPDCLIVYEDKLLLSSNNKYDKFHYSHISEIDSNLTLKWINKYRGRKEEPNNNYLYIGNDGILILDDYKYLYGRIHNAANLVDSAQVIKINKYGKELWRKYYSYGDQRVDINNMRVMPDGNLAFILHLKSPPGANNGYDGHMIMKIDTSGAIIDSLRFENWQSHSNRFLASSDGNYYFYSYYTELLSNPRRSDGNYLNKLNSTMDTWLWNLHIPYSAKDHRGGLAHIYDYTEAANGDILLCGSIFDISDSQEIGIGDINSARHGFIIRFTPEGEIVWLRLYKYDNDLVDREKYGRFRPSAFFEILELEDSRIMVGGNILITGPQFGVLYDQLEKEIIHLTINIVDSNGCIEGEECQEIIRLDGKIEYDEPMFPIGTKWYYEYFPKSNDENKKIHSYIRYEVTDSIHSNDTIVYTIDNNRGLPPYRIIQGREEIWFWDSIMGDYQLTYDFDANLSYKTKYKEGNDIVETRVSIDEVGFIAMPDLVQYGDNQMVSIYPNGSLSDTLRLELLEDCGKLYGGLTLGLGRRNTPQYDSIGMLRCFEKNGKHHNFNQWPYPPLPCDSVWTEIINNVEVIKPDNGIEIYPNPVSHILQIGSNNGIINHYQIVNMLGEKIMIGKNKNKVNVSHLPMGIYYIKLMDNKSNFKTLQFIKI